MGPPIDRPNPHLLLISYLFLPSSRSGARRATALRDALEDLGVRTTVLTSTVSGRSESDNAESIVRAGDVRSLKGLSSVTVTDHGRRRWWTQTIVPDSTVLSWAPRAALAAERIVRKDRPDAVFTSSPPESVHLLGLALHARGVPWVADFRDGWTFEPPTLRPYATRLDRRLERKVVTAADAVTVVTAHLADDLRARYGRRIVELPNGFEPARVAGAPDGRSLLDAARFSLVHTGTLGLNGKDPLPFLRALSRLLAEQPTRADVLEVVFAGPLTSAEERAMRDVEPAGVITVLGEVPHAQALGLQAAADGLLLVTPPKAARDAATAKVYEYLAAGKPILALAAGTSAAALLGDDDTIAAPDDEEQILAALREYLDRWALHGDTYLRSVDLDRHTFPQIARRLLDLLVEIGAVEPLQA